MPEQLFVPQKQHDYGYTDLFNGLQRAGMPNARRITDLISKHLKDNTLPSFLAVERWAFRYQSTIPSNGYDAIVNGGTTSDPGSRSFGTVFEAIRYLDSLGYITARIGVAARGTVITETAALGATTNLLTVDIEGVDGGDDGATLANYTPWSHGGFSTTGTGLKTWGLHGLNIQTGAKNVAFFQGNSLNIRAVECKWTASAATSSACPSIAGTLPLSITLLDCQTQDVDPSNAYIYDTLLFWNITTTVTATGPWYQYGCYYSWNSPVTINQATTGATTGAAKAMHMLGATFGHASVVVGTSATDQLTINVTGAHNATAITGGGHLGGAADLAISVSNYAYCYIDVNAILITIGAADTSTTYPAQAWVGGTCAATADITGPCGLGLTAERAILRGNAIGGVLELVFKAASGTALTGTSVTDSAVLIAARRHPGQASSTQKGYAIDAGSARNVFIFAGGNNFPTASTNASATTTIITEAGSPPSGAAGGSLAGSTYPNPVLAANTVGPTELVATAVTAAAYGGATKIPSFTVDADGRLTLAADNDPTGTNQDFAISVAGKGLKIKEGANAKMGVATLVAGTVTVNTTAVTATSRIFLTVQSLGTVALPQAVAVTAITAATSFVITSFDATDTSVVAWMIVEPA